MRQFAKDNSSRRFMSLPASESARPAADHGYLLVAVTPTGSIKFGEVLKRIIPAGPPGLPSSGHKIG